MRRASSAIRIFPNGMIQDVPAGGTVSHNPTPTPLDPTVVGGGAENVIVCGVFPVLGAGTAKLQVLACEPRMVSVRSLLTGATVREARQGSGVAVADASAQSAMAAPSWNTATVAGIRPRGQQ